jgi:hypothetical protein
MNDSVRMMRRSLEDGGELAYIRNTSSDVTTITLMSHLNLAIIIGLTRTAKFIMLTSSTISNDRTAWFDRDSFCRYAFWC